MKFIIIEDESPAARGLEDLIKQVVPDATLLAILTSVEDSIKWFQETKEEPELAFFDIQLKEALSFEIFKKVKVKCPVIFCTAYNQYAIEAFQTNGIDYLLKPIELDDLERSISKYQNLKQSFQELDVALFQKLEKLVDGQYNSGKQRFLVKAGKKFFHVNQDNIAYIYTANKVVHLVTHDNRSFVLDHNLEEMEQQLSTSDFFRINRQYIVSIGSIQSVENDYGAYHINLVPETSDLVNVSKYRLESFKQWMNGLAGDSSWLDEKAK